MENRSKDFVLIPYPSSLIPLAGYFELTSETLVEFDIPEMDIPNGVLERVWKKCDFIGSFLSNEIEKITGVRLTVLQPGSFASLPEKRRESGIVLRIKPGDTVGMLDGADVETRDESYRLVVKPKRVGIEASSVVGLFYGVVTLVQLAFQCWEGGGVIRVKAVRIEDTPLFKWRGMGLDVARHFFSKEFLFKIIDILAMYKLNVLHLHLTDDQGWRVEIDKWPKLTKVGAWRRENGVRYGGFYSKIDIKEIVEYAGSRFINVLPEIDMPGHVQAALAAYPFLSCTKESYGVKEDYGISDRVFCVGQEETYGFVEDVLSELKELFPFKYFHIGGDECPTAMWEVCPLCNKRKNEEQFSDFKELQGYFETRVAGILSKFGKVPVGWDEIAETCNIHGAVIVNWRDKYDVDVIAERGYRVILANSSYCYFDYGQTYRKDELKPVHFNPPITTVYRVYSFDPIGRTGVGKSSVMGIMGELWTENLASERDVEYMLLPRLSALSEVMWLPASSRRWEDFETRLIRHGELLKGKGISFQEDYRFWK